MCIPRLSKSRGRSAPSTASAMRRALHHGGSTAVLEREPAARDSWDSTRDSWGHSARPIGYESWRGCVASMAGQRPHATCPAAPRGPSRASRAARREGWGGGTLQGPGDHRVPPSPVGHRPRSQRASSRQRWSAAHSQPSVPADRRSGRSREAAGHSAAEVPGYSREADGYDAPWARRIVGRARAHS